MSNTIDSVQNNSSSNVIEYDDAQVDLYFKMHKKIHSKKAETGRSYNNNLLLQFEDIKELHLKTIQSIESLRTARNSINIQIAVSHNEGETEKFNSFEDFEKHNCTSPNPTENIIFRYDFIFYDVESGKIEDYRVTNEVRSRVAELEQIEKEAPPFISKAIITGLITKTANITIEYDDYVKARHFIAMFDEWVKGCDESKNIQFINYLKKVSHLIPRFGRLIILALLALFTAAAIDSNLINPNLTVKFIVIYASVLLIITGLADTFLRKTEASIDSYLAISYININKGDAKLIKKYLSRNTSSFIWALIGIAGTICVGVLTNSVYDLIKWLLLK